MRIAFNGLTALRIVRSIRSGAMGPCTLSDRERLFAPDPGTGRTRFTKGCFSSLQIGLDWSIDERLPIEVAVPNQASRLQLSCIKSTVYSTREAQESFVRLCGLTDDAILLPCPELLFVEMARVMPLPHLILFGCELCGSYSRDALCPHDGEVTYWVEPMTSVYRLSSFVEQCPGISGINKARTALRMVMDNAWSPIEALVAMMASLSPDQYGYGLGPVKLNRRVNVEEVRSSRLSRVPDMQLAGSDVGLNYDGFNHLDLHAVAQAALSVGADSGSDAKGNALQKTLEATREKYVDDRRRDRELVAAGHPTLVVTYEDLLERGGLDRVFHQAIQIIERAGRRDLSLQKTLLRIRTFSRERQDLLWSCMPGKVGAEARGRIARREERAARGARVSEELIRF